MSKKNKQGIVALFPAIIVSSILLILCVGASQSFLALLYRITLFDDKVQGDIIAHACALRVLAKRAQDSNYKGGDTITISNVSCTVGDFSTSTSYVSVKIGEAISVENVGH